MRRERRSYPAIIHSAVIPLFGPFRQQFPGFAAHRNYKIAIMARPDAVEAVQAVFESCKTTESRTSEVLASVLEILQELKTDGVELLLTQVARICGDASREGT